MVVEFLDGQKRGDIPSLNSWCLAKHMEGNKTDVEDDSIFSSQGP
jgi:hypothetical protein